MWNDDVPWYVTIDRNAEKVVLLLRLAAFEEALPAGCRNEIPTLEKPSATAAWRLPSVLWLMPACILWPHSLEMRTVKYWWPVVTFCWEEADLWCCWLLFSLHCWHKHCRKYSLPPWCRSDAVKACWRLRLCDACGRACCLDSEVHSLKHCHFSDREGPVRTVICVWACCVLSLRLETFHDAASMPFSLMLQSPRVPRWKCCCSHCWYGGVRLILRAELQWWACLLHSLPVFCATGLASGICSPSFSWRQSVSCRVEMMILSELRNKCRNDLMTLWLIEGRMILMTVSRRKVTTEVNQKAFIRTMSHLIFLLFRWLFCYSCMWKLMIWPFRDHSLPVGTLLIYDCDTTVKLTWPDTSVALYTSSNV